MKLSWRRFAFFKKDALAEGEGALGAALGLPEEAVQAPKKGMTLGALAASTAVRVSGKTSDPSPRFRRAQRACVAFTTDARHCFFGTRLANPTGDDVDAGGEVCAASNGSLVRFDEKPTPEKLDVLFRMNMFATAIQVGAAARLRPGAIMEIYKMYGDHLYKKCDWTGAVEQYADRYGKLKNVAALDHFAAYEGDLCFDAATAVVALRDAGYVDHAVGLAARWRVGVAEKALRRKEKKRKNRESKRPAALPGDDDDDDEPPIADDFMHLFIHQPAYLRLFCDYVLRYDDRGRTMNVCNTLLEMLLDEWDAKCPSRRPNPAGDVGQPEPPAPPLPEHQDAHDAHVDKCDELGEILRVIHDEKALPPLRVISTVAENEQRRSAWNSNLQPDFNVPLSAVKPYVMTIVEKNWNDTRRERDAATLLKHENEKMKQQIHDLKCAQVRLLPGRGGPEDRIANSKVGTAEAAMLDVLLYEAKEQEDAALGADGGSATSRRRTSSAKWESIKKSMEVVDHEQFFKDLEDEETGGFDCIARYLGKGIMQPAPTARRKQRQKAGLPEMEKIDYDDLPCLPRPKNPEYKVRQNLANPNTRNY
ncbi:hypothetical protein SO694_00066189 [Aureococcus anophagefferens]|uniref:Vacuolar protein sorting protein 11 C-terminal domain-containing protein n=1 Tax=Aureococcus anophagefferens TaxID=44056 RepID=A0ABR1FQ77_AURAN